MHSILIGKQEILEKSAAYYLLMEEAGNVCESYGVEVCFEDGEQCRIPGITCSQTGILCLISMLMRCTVTPVALRDVVDDWILR